jgi:hypothetical protein
VTGNRKGMQARYDKRNRDREENTEGIELKGSKKERRLKKLVFMKK